MEQRKEAIMAALDAFARQRPGLEFGNYGDVSAYRSESRSITRDLHDYGTLAGAVRWRDGIGADDLMRAARDAYSGRLTLKCEQVYKPGEDFRTGRSYPRASVEYVTGQYFPTEYRKAACAVLASALWDYARANMPKPAGYRAESWASPEGRERSAIYATREEAEAELERRGGRDYGSVRELYAHGRKNLSAGDWLRAHFREWFGARLAYRWFR